MTTADPTSPAPVRTSARIPVQTVVPAWLLAGLVVAGYAWALGLQATWWQRLVLAAPVALAVVLDSRGVYAVVDARHAVTRALSDFGWLQLPLAVAGGAWMAGLTAGLVTRLLTGALILAASVLIRHAPAASARKGVRR